MLVFGSGTLVPALIRGQQRLAELRRRLAVELVQCSDLSDDVGQRDSVRQAVSLDLTRPEYGRALFMNFSRDTRWGVSHCQTPRANSASEFRLFPRGFFVREIRHFRPPQ